MNGCNARHSYAWVSPDGKVHLLNGLTHDEFARETVGPGAPKFNPEYPTHDGATAELLTQGWIRVSNPYALDVTPKARSKAWHSALNLTVDCARGQNRDPFSAKVTVDFAHPGSVQFKILTVDDIVHRYAPALEAPLYRTARRVWERPQAGYWVQVLNADGKEKSRTWVEVFKDALDSAERLSQSPDVQRVVIRDRTDMPLKAFVRGRRMASPDLIRQYPERLQALRDKVAYNKARGLENTAELWLLWSDFYRVARAWSVYVIDNLALPAKTAKAVEMAARLFSKEYPRGKGPPSILQWFDTNEPRFELLDQARSWPVRTEETGVMQWGPFTVHDTIQASPKALATAKEIVTRASRDAQNFPGLAQVVYGQLFLVGQIGRKNWAAWYMPDKDVIYLRPGVAGSSVEDSAQHLIHELGHRFWAKKLTPAIKSAWTAYHTKRTWQKPSRRLPEVGEILAAEVNRKKVRVEAYDDYGDAILVDVATGATVGKVNRLRLSDWVQDADFKLSFPTLYAEKGGPEEHFCESLSLYCQGRLTGANLTAFEEIVLGKVPKTAAVPDKYSEIDFKSPAAVANAAAKGLEYRQKASPSNKGGLTPSEASKQGIGSGVQRAVNLKNRDNISPDVIRQMTSFFSRHEKNKAISPDNKDTPWNDKGHVAWLIWGGDPGKTWAEKVRRQMDAADKQAAVKKAMLTYIAAEDGDDAPKILRSQYPSTLVLRGTAELNQIAPMINRVLPHISLEPTSVPKPKLPGKAYHFHWSNAQAAWGVIPVREYPVMTDGAEFVLFMPKGVLNPVYEAPWSLRDMAVVARQLGPHPGYSRSYEFSSRRR